MNQSTVGVGKNNALINLHLGHWTDRHARRWTVLTTGQPNAMGGREVGCPHRRQVPVCPGPRASGRGGDPLGHPARRSFRQARLFGGGVVPGARPGKGQSRLDHVYQPCRLDARPRPRGKGLTPGGIGRRTGCLPPDRHDAVCRRAVAGCPMAGERRGDDQLRAYPHLPPRLVRHPAKRSPTGRS